MKYSDVIVAGGTVAQTFDRSADAEAAAARMRAAGFPDVRLSERSGKTAEAHVAPEGGATEIDFAMSLEQAGFAAHAAQAITRTVAQGGVLLTVLAGSRVESAVAVLRGETVAAVPLTAVDLPVPSDHARVADAASAGAASASAAAASADSAPAAAPIQQSDDRVIALREERLEIGKERSTSEARVRKEIVTEQRTITVPVTREQLVIERDGEETVRIPLSETH